MNQIINIVNVLILIVSGLCFIMNSGFILLEVFIYLFIYLVNSSFIYFKLILVKSSFLILSNVLKVFMVLYKNLYLIVYFLMWLLATLLLILIIYFSYISVSFWVSVIISMYNNLVVNNKTLYFDISVFNCSNNPLTPITIFQNDLLGAVCLFVFLFLTITFLVSSILLFSKFSNKTDSSSIYSTCYHNSIISVLTYKFLKFLINTLSFLFLVTFPFFLFPILVGCFSDNSILNVHTGLTFVVLNNLVGVLCGKIFFIIILILPPIFLLFLIGIYNSSLELDCGVSNQIDNTNLNWVNMFLYLFLKDIMKSLFLLFNALLLLLFICIVLVYYTQSVNVDIKVESLVGFCDNNLLLSMVLVGKCVVVFSTLCYLLCVLWESYLSLNVVNNKILNEVKSVEIEENSLSFSEGLLTEYGNSNSKVSEKN